MRVETYERIKAYSDWLDAREAYRIAGETPPEDFPMTDAAYAESIGVSRRTIAAWKKTEEFQALRRAAAMDPARAFQLRELAMQRLVDLLAPNVNSREQLGAIKMIFEITADAVAAAKDDPTLPTTLEEVNARYAQLLEEEKALREGR